MRAEDVVNRIKELLKEYGWTSYRLSQESGVSETTISNILNKKKATLPRLDTLQQLCDGFNISLSDFFSSDSAKRAYLSMPEQLLFEEIDHNHNSKSDIEHFTAYVKLYNQR